MISGIFIGFANGLSGKELEELKKDVENTTGYGAEILEMDKSTHAALLVNSEKEVKK